MAGSKKIDGIIRVDEPKGYRTPSKIVAASTKSTDNGGLPRVITHEPDLSAARSLQRSLGLIGNSVEELGTSIEYHNKQVEAEEERQKKKAEFEAEKARIKAKKEDYKDAKQYATDHGYQIVEEAQNHFKKVLSELSEDEFNPIEFMDKTVVPYVNKMREGASEEQNNAMGSIYHNILKFGFEEGKKRQVYQRDKNYSSRMLGAIRNSDASIEELTESFSTMKERYIESGGDEAGFASIRDSALLTEGIKWRNDGNTNAFEDNLDRLYESGLLDYNNPADLETMNKLDMLEAQAEKAELEDQQQHLEKAALMAEEYAQKFESLDDLDQEMEHMQSIKTDANNPYASKWRDIHLAALGEQKNILLGKSGEYKELIGYADELTSGYFKSAGVDLGDGSSVGGIGVAQMKTGSGQIVQAHPMLIELERKAAIRESVTFLQKNNLDSDIQSDASREAVLNIFQKRLGKFGTVKEDGSFAGFTFSDPSYIEERPPEKWTPQYMTARKGMYYDKVKKLAEIMPIIDAVSEVIPEGAPEYKHYRSLFYDKFVVEQRQKQHLEYAQSEAKRYKMEGQAVDDMRAEEMANQRWNVDFTDSERDELYSEGFGAWGGFDAGIFDHSFLDSVTADVKATFDNAEKYANNVRDLYKVTRYPSGVWASAEELMIKENGGKNPLKNMSVDQQVETIEQLLLEGKIKDANLNAYRELSKQVFDELYRVKDENGKLKNIIINEAEEPKTTMRIEGYNQ